MLFEAQKLIYNALSGDSTFMNLISNRLYDQPDTNEIYPYVIIGNGTSQNHLTHGKDGIFEFMNITIFTKPDSLGWYPAKNIVKSIRSKLHLKKFSINSTYKNCICIQDSENRENTGTYRNIDLVYKIIIEEV
jgi:Protein of unknown function (DUF3168)